MSSAAFAGLALMVNAWASEAPAPAAASSVTALVCNDTSAAAGVGATSATTAAFTEELRLLGGLGVTLTASDPAGACQALRLGKKLDPAMPDLVVAIAPNGGEGLDRVKVRMAFHAVGHDVVVKVFGRELTGTFTTKSLFVPPAPADFTPEGAVSRAPIAAKLFAGLAGALAYGKLAARVDQTADQKSLTESARRSAATALAQADVEWLSTEAPITAAVVKQVRGMLALAESCPDEASRDLFYAALRLVPYSPEARVLVALARLRDAYIPQTCALGAEQDLFRSLEANPWNDEAVDNLGVLYELTLDAHPASEAGDQVSAKQAAERLDRVWKHESPAAPMALELGFGGSLSSAVDESLDTLGPGIHLDMAYGRDGRGWGFRLEVDVPWARQISFPQSPNSGGGAAWVGWTRPSLGIGPRYRLQFGAQYGEIEPSLLVGAPIAVGHGFDVNYRATGINVGGRAGLRFGRRLGHFSLWVGASIAYFAGQISRELSATGGAATTLLPRYDLSLLGGASVLLWR